MKAFSTDVYLDSNRSVLQDFVKRNLFGLADPSKTEPDAVLIQVKYGNLISMLECFEADYSNSLMRQMFYNFSHIPGITENILFRCDCLPLATFTLPMPALDTVFRMLGKDQEMTDLRYVL